MKYEVDIKVTGYMRVYVVAEDEGDAHDKATDEFAMSGMRQPIGDLLWKDTETTITQHEEN
jgi:hypothetical protein